MNVHEFKQQVEESGCTKLDLLFQTQSGCSRILSAENFLFFEQTKNYLVSVVSSAVGKYSSIGGVPDERAGGTRSIGHALNEDIFFPGFFLLWASSLGYEVNSLQVDIRPVPPEDKAQEKGPDSVQMVDVAGDAAARYFSQCYELVRQELEIQFGTNWLTDWPPIIQFARLIRNALSHNGNWHSRNRNASVKVFRWERANLNIQMQDEFGNLVDEGKNVLTYLNGADFVVLLVEINDFLTSEGEQSR